jgi:aldose 1-epimerase
MLTLISGASSIVVAPETGGGLIGWMLGAAPLLRRALPQAVVGGSPHALACFPLLPYANRIGLRRFSWDGQEHVLRDNFDGRPHTIHGVGWQRPWSVLQAQADHAALTLTHAPDADWPFAFQARLDYRLSAGGLTVRLSLTNRHHAAAPAGIGLHPYLPKRPGLALRFAAAGVWHNGEDALPRTHRPIPRQWDHRRPRAVAGSRLDNSFTGWRGVADVLAGGGGGLRIEADPVFGNLQVFTPDWADFMCVEPVSHVPDALNRADLPAAQAMRRLAPGATLCGEIRLLVAPA